MLSNRGTLDGKSKQIKMKRLTGMIAEWQAEDETEERGMEEGRWINETSNVASKGME